MERTFVYTKKRLRKTLILAVFYWVLFGLYFTSSAIRLGYLHFGWLLVALFGTWTYYRERRLQYLTLIDGVLKKNELWGRSIRLEEVIHIEKYAGEYILKTPDRKLRIDTHIIASNSLKELESILQTLPRAKAEAKA